jgi:hypothetical protein
VILNNFGGSFARDRDGNPSSINIRNAQYSSYLSLGQDLSQNAPLSMDYDGMATLFSGAYGGLNDSG